MEWISLLRYPTNEQLQQTIKYDNEINDNNDDYIFWKNRMDKIFSTLTLDEQERAGQRFLGNLQEINFDTLHWDNFVAEEIFPFCSELSYLSLHSCNTLDKHTFDSIVRSNCSLLSLDIGYMISSCSSSDGIGQLNCDELRCLYAHSSFRDEIIHSWLDNHPNACKKLNSIAIHWSDNTKDAGMSKLLQRCGKALRSFTAGLCYFLSFKTFESLSLYCNNITELDLCSIPNINDESLLKKHFFYEFILISFFK